MNLRQKFINDVFKFVAILENSGDFIFQTAGLTIKTYGVLHLISIGLDTSGDILSGTYGSKPNMAKKLKYLEDNGFVSRSVDPRDRRVFRFRTTEKAEKAIKKISPHYDAATALVFSGVSDADLETALCVIERCLANFETSPKTS